MVTCYFVLGTVIILSLNSWIGNFAEAFWAGVASILGGVADSVAVAVFAVGRSIDSGTATGYLKNYGFRFSHLCRNQATATLRPGGCFSMQL